MQIINKSLFLWLLIWLFPCGLSAKILYEQGKDIIDLELSARMAPQYESSQKDTSGLYSYLDGSAFFKKEVNQDLSVKFFVSSRYDSNTQDDENYRNIGEFYIGFDDFRYGSIYLGRTPSVYYNGFAAGWLDYNLNGGNEIIDPYKNGDFLGTNSVSNSVFYTYRFSSFKIAVQFAGADNNEYIESNIGGNRNYEMGLGLGYALGPIQFGVSYLQGDFDRDTSKGFTGDYNTTKIFGMGANFAYKEIYTAIGFFYDKNRWEIGNESYALKYIVKYDYYVGGHKLVPQLMYGYQYFSNKGGTTNTTADLIAENFINFALMYYVEKNVDIFLDTKIDVRSKNQVRNVQNVTVDDMLLRNHKVMVGIRYDFN